MNGTSEPTVSQSTTTSATTVAVSNVLKANITTERKENNNDSNDDDWAIDPNKIDNNFADDKITVPHFIRLFVINRIICTYIERNSNTNSNGTHETKSQTIIEELVSVFNDDKKIQSKSKEILTRLLNNGIKLYMNKWYNEKDQSNIIEIIFNKIILNKFENEYNRVMKYNNPNAKFEYQNVIFNSNDLMCLIFEYLENGRYFKHDLFHCSLVNSHWLYHVWNVNSVYYVELTQLIQQTLKHTGTNSQSLVLRAWQRFINAKSIYIYWVKRNISCDKQLLNKLLLFKNLEKIFIYLGNDEEISIEILKTIMYTSRENIEWCKIQMKPTSRTYHCLSPLSLLNAKYISIHDSYFYRIWSNECQELALSEFRISRDWCNFVIKNCDCSNIKSLTFGYHIILFEDDWYSAVKTEDELLIKQFGLKFLNLKKLILKFAFNIHGQIDRKIILFWRLLKPIIIKNNIKVELELDRSKHDEYTFINKMIKEENNLKIFKLEINMVRTKISDTRADTIECIKQCDENNGLKYLDLHIGSISESIWREKFAAYVLFKSIQVFKLQISRMIDLNELISLLLNQIIEKKLLVIVDANKPWYDGDIFEQLYKYVCQLFINQIAIDISIPLDKYDDGKVFLSYFKNAIFLSKYDKPQCRINNCEQVGIAREKAYVAVVNNSRGSGILRVSNVELTEHFV